MRGTAHHVLCPTYQVPDKYEPCVCIQLEAAENDMLDRVRDAVAVLLPADYEMNWCAAIDAIDALRKPT